MSGWAKAFDRRKTARELRPWFDSAFYLRTNPDVAAAKMDPLDHYVKYGAAEGRQPHPLFDPAHYLACCPDARNAENPLLHYVRNTSGKWPSTHPLFDNALSTSNPLLYYLGQNTHEGTEGSQFGQC